MARLQILAALADFDWRDLKDIETAGNWPVAVQGLVLLSVFLLAVPAGQLVSTRLGGERRILEQEAEALQRDLQVQSQAAEALPAQKAATLKHEETLAEFHRHLSLGKQVPEILDSITSAGREHRLEFVNVSLPARRIHPFYTEQPILMKVRGSYHDFASFISAVAALPQMVTLHDFSLERLAPASLDIDFTLRIYQHDPASGSVAVHIPVGSEAAPDGAPSATAYRNAAYAGAALRSPFDDIGTGLTAESPAPAIAPLDRPAEALEGFPLSELSMVGTISHGAVTQALVRDSHGRVHRLRAGNYMGQDHGRIQRITATRIDLVESVQGAVGWVQRPRALLLQRACPAPCERMEQENTTHGQGADERKSRTAIRH